MDVSILVLVDVALRRLRWSPRHHTYKVSILVLVDVALRLSNMTSTSGTTSISILVLVDVALRLAASATPVSFLTMFQSLF